MDPLNPRDPLTLGSYRLLGRLGEGGQGVVYKAESDSGELYAIKLMHGRFIDTFQREVAAARKVAPFCTAQVIEVGPDFIVTEFVDGPSLSEAIESNGPLTGADLYRLAVGTATALAAIHQAGIVHRDFKPGNVLLSHDGPRVIDFGISRQLDATLSATNSILGTPSYMAPEHLAGEPVTETIDVFAWAATIAFAATGHAPFGHDTIPAVMNRILNGTPDLGLLDNPLRGLLAQCLVGDPCLRPDISQVLRRLLEHNGEDSPLQVLDTGRTVAEAPGEDLADARTTRWTTLRLQPADAEQPKDQHRRRSVLAVTAIVAACAIGLGAGAYQIGRNEAPQKNLATANLEPTSRPTAVPDPIGSLLEPTWTEADIGPSPKVLLSPVLLIASPATIDDAYVKSIEKIRGVLLVTVVDGATTRVNGRAVGVLGVDPRTFRQYTPHKVASNDRLWRNLAGGDLVTTLRTFKLGTVVTVGSKGHDLRVGAVSQVGVAGVQVLVSRRTASDLGMAYGNALIIAGRPEDSTRIAKTAKALLPKNIKISVLRTM